MGSTPGTFGGATWGSFRWGQTAAQISQFVGPVVSTIINEAQRIAGVLVMPGFQGSPEDSADALQALNRIVDRMAARKMFAFSETFQVFTLTPNHQPHLIGPNTAAPDFLVPIRPMKFDHDGASLILTTSTPNVDLPLRIRDADWWHNERIKALATSIPTDLYYEPDFPNGALFLWPVPTVAYGLRLRIWTVVQQFQTVTQNLIAPPAYLDSVTMRLAKNLHMKYRYQLSLLPWPPENEYELSRADAALQSNNAASPRIDSADAGTRGGTGRSTFNYYTGMPGS